MSEFSTPIKTVKTRKEHSCCCFQRFIESDYSVDDISDEYREAIEKLYNNDGKIPKGTECYTWSGKFDGKMFTAYADKDMYRLICEMGWFDN